MRAHELEFPMAPPRVLGSPVGVLALAACVLILGGCQRVGMERPGSSARPQAASSAPEMPQRAELVPSAVPSPAELAPPSIDPILHTPTVRDPGIEAQTAFWIDFWSHAQVTSFERYLERLGHYGPMVHEEIRKRELPPSLAFLPIVESGYFPTARSGVGATGLWQIMEPTGRGLGLAINGIVDDRRDPVASTLAALDYLEQLHGMFGSWYLALAAYNAGPGRVGGLLERYGASGGLTPDEQFLQIRPYLPAETREFVPRFLAAATLASDPVAFGFPPIPENALRFDEVRLPDATSLDVVARAAGVSHQEVAALNPQLLRGFTPHGEPRTIRIPAGRAQEFEANFALIPPHERISFLEHVVATGETFSHIARMYGVSVADLQGMNSSVDPRRMQIGMRISVPAGGAAPSGGMVSGGMASVAERAGGAAESPRPTHIVSEGDSLSEIARSYGVTTEALAEANERAIPDPLRIGEELSIP